ncbi:hypothetical protein Pmar_PMAR014543 [Perkinsus marinus ATCC 50983]|uniref:Uncharacterized protein n=1 Tax=Perkinsus marinus (strain ATCC 50983 / TXsc) TaxID=423536 RepID=C5KWD1_PERM5|nr:hypothetical protein Pmar_PMAR014543 [Perkinsus marinus ATCC 50983]EER11242.1 hypothetical protein Pmar_PMAR014543 [Perkinsus marinus ATCC 50983]|eukprot:XP_002779447.1 hypothetical protein Pmar_PMAR014543 [Perkinsus marinus ATCC 50983]
MSESKDRAAFMMINEAKARMSDKPVPAIIKGLLEVDPSKRLTCCDAYDRLNKHKDKENSIIEDTMPVKPLKDYFGNYDILDLINIDEFDEDDPYLSDFDIDDYMRDEMRIMEVVGWCAFVQPVSSQAEVDRLVGNAVSKRSLKGKRKRKAEKQIEKRRKHATRAQYGGDTVDSDDD